MNGYNANEYEKKLLDEIFSITGELYREMSQLPEGTQKDHIRVYQLLTELGKSLVNADRASFWKLDKRNRSLWTAAATGAGRITIPEGSGLVGKAISENRAIITNDPYNHPDFNSDVDKKTGYVTKSVLVMPVSNCRGEVIGAYQAINKLDGGGFDMTEDIKKLSLAAFICGLSLESELFLDDAQHDKLTDLKNRTGFYSDFTRRYSGMLRSSEDAAAVSLFICDIDHFKSVNDTYGHNAGDAVLRHVSEILRRNSRARDDVYRWGGEEFIVILPDTPEEFAAKSAERLRSRIMDSVCEFEDKQIKVTMSFGVIQLDSALSIEDNIKRADSKLYTAKESGRNTVIV